MTHYFMDNRQLKHDRKEISFRFLGVLYSFMTDSGVFSKDKVDTGSAILLEALSKEALSGRVLDLGCGYGVIGIVLAKVFQLSLTAVDVNARAIELVEENAMRNQVEIEAVLSEGEFRSETKFSNVVLNPPIRAGKKVIYQLFDDAFDCLTEKGQFYIVIRKQHGADSAIAKLKERYKEVVVIRRDKGFMVIKSKKT